MTTDMGQRIEAMWLGFISTSENGIPPEGKPSRDPCLTSFLCQRASDLDNC